MTFDEEQKLLADNAAMKEQVEKLTTALMAIAEPEPQKIPWNTGESIRADLAAVAAGRIVIEPPPEEPVKLKEGQISRTDPNLGKHLTEIAAGKLEVV